MDDLMDLYKKYIDGEYDISDVSRIVSYIALPNVSEEYIRQLSIYKKYVESKIDLPIECYLYSLAKGVSKKVECIENF